MRLFNVIIFLLAVVVFPGPAGAAAAPVSVRFGTSKQSLVTSLQIADSREERSLPEGPVSGRARTITVTGMGIPPVSITNATIRREMAERAALTDARRKLAQELAGLRTNDGRSLRSRLGKNKFSQKVQGFIKGAAVTGTREKADGTVELDLELPLSGRSGLSRYLEE